MFPMGFLFVFYILTRWAVAQRLQISRASKNQSETLHDLCSYVIGKHPSAGRNSAIEDGERSITRAKGKSPYTIKRDVNNLLMHKIYIFKNTI